MLEYDAINRLYPVVQRNDLVPLHAPRKDKPLYVASFTSHSGAITCKALELQSHFESAHDSAPYEIIFLFTDTRNPKGSNAFFEYCNLSDVASRHGIPLEVIDIEDYYRSLGYEGKTDPRLSFEQRMEIRKGYDARIIRAMDTLDVPVEAIVLDYYWSLCTPLVTDKFLTINSHLGDLSLKDEKGNRILRGYHPVRKAILGGSRSLYSTTHVVDRRVDGGDLLLRSRPLEVLGEITGNDSLDAANLEDPANLNLVEDYYEARMLEACDSYILPLSLLLVSEGRFARDQEGGMYFNGHKMDSAISL